MHLKEENLTENHTIPISEMKKTQVCSWIAFSRKAKNEGRNIKQPSNSTKSYFMNSISVFWFNSSICRHRVLLIQRCNSWKYHFVEVSGHTLEISQTWGFYLHFCLSTKCFSRINFKKDKNLLYRHDSPKNQRRKDPLHMYSLSPHLSQFQQFAGATLLKYLWKGAW
jgi:hypothetical protein